MWFSKKMNRQANQVCSCGHDRGTHEHYRAGTECAICDIRSCSSFTPTVVLEYTEV